MKTDKEVLERLEERIARLLMCSTDEDEEHAFALAVTLSALRQAIAQERTAAAMGRIADALTYKVGDDERSQIALVANRILVASMGKGRQ